MKIRSFRLRILVLSVVVSGLVILGFGAWTWTMIHDLTGIHRLDSELVALASGQASAPADGRAWRAFEDALARLSEADPTHQLAFAVLSRTGENIYRSAPWPEDLLPRLGHPENSPPHPRTVFLNASAWRVALQHRPERSLIVAADMGPYLAHAHRLQAAFLLALVMALGCAGGGAWFLAWQAVRPLTALIEATEGITAQALEQRIPQRGLGDEFDQLIQVFNEMLERLERSFHHATRFSADAAHELKTPLTILQGQLEQALQEAPVGSPLQQNLGRLLEEVQRLKVIIRRLLLLSLADAGKIRVSTATLQLDELVAQLIEDVEILAPDVKVEQEIGDGMAVEADSALLQQAIQNLVNNAIKYNVEHGKIRFQLFRTGEMIRLAVANTSEGIPEQERGQIFRRFYRADPAHSRKVDGVGLGLSLSREILRAHGGKLWLADAPEGWVMFVMELPATPVGDASSDRREGSNHVTSGS